MGKKSLVILSVIWIGLLMVTSCVWKSQQVDNNRVSDEDYIAIARADQDAKAFLEKYPQAETYVDKSGRLAVDFRVSKHPMTNTTQLWEGIRLRVFIDPKTNQLMETFIDCNGKIINKNVRKYLEQYAATLTCTGED